MVLLTLEWLGYPWKPTSPHSSQNPSQQAFSGQLLHQC